MREKPQKKALTKTAVEAIRPPSQGRIYIYDAKQPGLAICVTAAGTRTWYWYRKVNGKPERTRIGEWPGCTCDQARDEAAKLNGVRAVGENPNDKRRTVRDAPTLREAFEEYLSLPTRTKAKRPKSAKTIHEYRLQFEAYLGEWHNRKITSLTRAEIERKQNYLANNNGYYVANRVVAMLKAVLNVAMDNGQIKANPAARLTKFEEVARDRFLQADELPKFWEALEAEPSEKIRDFLKIALFTGQRRGNVATMKWSDVNLESGVWTIPQTKTGRHVVPLIGPAIEILKRRAASKGAGDYVFPGRHGDGYLQDPMRQWREILKRAGIGDLRIHDLRRSMGSWQAKTGASLTVVGKTLGHSRPETTAIYSRLDDDPVRKAMETAAAAIVAAAIPSRRHGERKSISASTKAKADGNG